MPPSGSLCVWGQLQALRRITRFIEKLTDTCVHIDRTIVRLLDASS
jgi:hypothetical protein